MRSLVVIVNCGNLAAKPAGNITLLGSIYVKLNSIGDCKILNFKLNIEKPGLFANRVSQY
jgi:hypothetical protein